MQGNALSPFSFQPLFVERLFSDLFPEAPATEWQHSPAVDVKETKDAFQIELDVPGLKKEEIQIELKENRLTISGERKRAAKEESKDLKHFRAERTFGKFYREVGFATDVDAEKVEARYEDGVLNITVPKVEPKKPHLIAIK